MQSVLEHIKNYTHLLIAQACANGLVTNDDKQKPLVVVGLSGGPDSVFLLYVLHQMIKEDKCLAIAAHLDHEWREKSHEDIVFCQQLCQQWDIPFKSMKASHVAQSFVYNGSKEELGRHMRRAFFAQVMEETGAHLIALAHHAQDQQETFFMRLMRGTTLTGLCCMEESAHSYIRPLLLLSKQDIVSYLQAYNIPFLTDPTNDSDDFLRNRIRKYVLPALKKCDERFDSKFLSTLTHLQEEEKFIQTVVQQVFDRIFSAIPPQTSNLDSLKKTCGNNTCQQYQGNLTFFKELDSIMQRRIVRLWLIKAHVKFLVSTAFLSEIIRFLTEATAPSHRVGIAVTINKKKNLFWLEQTKEEDCHARK